MLSFVALIPGYALIFLGSLFAERNVARRALSIDGEDTPFGVQFAWAGLATFPNLPATSVPVGTDPRGLPIGVQVITNRFRDHDAIAVAALAHRSSRS